MTEPGSPRVGNVLHPVDDVAGAARFHGGDPWGNAVVVYAPA